MLQEEIISTLQQQNAEYKKEIEYLLNELAQLKRLLFGKKSERFISNETPLPQNTLFAVDEHPENKIENLTEVISYKREKPKIKKGGRKELPSHLVREITVIEPENKIEGDRLIGTLVTVNIGVFSRSHLCYSHRDTKICERSGSGNKNREHV